MVDPLKSENLVELMHLQQRPKISIQHLKHVIIRKMGNTVQLISLTEPLTKAVHLLFERKSRIITAKE